MESLYALPHLTAPYKPWYQTCFGYAYSTWHIIRGWQSTMASVVCTTQWDVSSSGDIWPTTSTRQSETAVSVREPSWPQEEGPPETVPCQWALGIPCNGYFGTLPKTTRGNQFTVNITNWYTRLARAILSSKIAVPHVSSIFRAKNHVIRYSYFPADQQRLTLCEQIFRDNMCVPWGRTPHDHCIPLANKRPGLKLQQNSRDMFASFCTRISTRLGLICITVNDAYTTQVRSPTEMILLAWCFHDNHLNKLHVIHQRHC